MATVEIIEAEGIVNVTLNGDVLKGDLIAHDATNWVQADASDAATNLYAQFVAMATGHSGDEIQACRTCTLFDSDTPYTANTTLFCSATAGEHTQTRPTTAADVIQIVGRTISTTKARIDIKPPRELETFTQPNTYDTTDEAGLGVIDDPKWVGPALDCAGEDAYFTGRFPSNVIAVDEAYIIYNSIGETTGTIEVNIVVCADSATNTGDTGTAHAAAAPTSIANNKLCYSDCSAIFDADALKPNYNFTVTAIAAGAFSGNLQVIGLYMRYIVV